MEKKKSNGGKIEIHTNDLSLLLTHLETLKKSLGKTSLVLSSPDSKLSLNIIAGGDLQIKQNLKMDDNEKIKNMILVLKVDEILKLRQIGSSCLQYIKFLKEIKDLYEKTMEKSLIYFKKNPNSCSAIDRFNIIVENFHSEHSFYPIEAIMPITCKSFL